MSYRYRIATVEAKDRPTLTEEINSALSEDERIVSASFGTREVGPENWRSLTHTATLLLEWEDD